MRFTVVLFLTLLVMLTGCSKHTYKHYDFEYTEHAYPWGQVAIWAIGTSLKDETTERIGPPYKLVIEFKIHEPAIGCSVSANSIKLLRNNVQTEMPLESPKTEDFKLDTNRSAASRASDAGDWYVAYFYIYKLQLDFVDYELSLNYSFKGNCGGGKGGSVNLPFKKKYNETSDSIMYQ